MKNLVNKGFKYFVAIMMVFSLMSMNAWANGPESSTSSETGSTTTENKGTTKDTGDSQGDTADQLISNEEKKTTTSKESDDKEGQTDQTTDKKTDYTYEDKKISVKAVLANASAISDQAELRVKEIPESTTEYKKYQEALNKKSNLYSNVLLYDISFILDGKEVEPTGGNVKVSMSFKDQQLSDDLNVKDNNDLKVIHFKDNDVNKQETLNANTNVNSSTTTFDMDSFSVIAFNTVDTSDLGKPDTSFDYKNLLGDAINYGIVTDNFVLNGGDAETNVATKLGKCLTQTGNDKTNDMEQSFILASVDQSFKIKGYQAYVQVPTADANKVTHSDSNKLIIDSSKTRVQLEQTVQDMEDHLNSWSTNLINKQDNAKIEYNKYSQKYSVDISGNDAGTYYISLDDVMMQNINGADRLQIKKKDDQTIVFNIKSQNKVLLNKFSINDLSPETFFHNSDDSKVPQSIIWNIPNASEVNTQGSITGIVLAPNATFNLYNTSSGWLYAQTVNIKSGEWHNVYQHVKQIRKPAVVQLHVIKTVDNKDPDSSEDGKFNFKLQEAAVSNGQPNWNDLTDRRTVQNSKSLVGFKTNINFNIKYQNDKDVGTHYYIISEDYINGYQPDHNIYVKVVVNKQEKVKNYDNPNNIVEETILTASVTYYSDPNLSTEMDDPKINNSKVTTTTTCKISIQKTVNGSAPGDKQFKFNLDEGSLDSKGEFIKSKNVQENATNDKNGNVTFNELNYTEAGTHYYMISEEDKDNANYVSSGNIYVKVDVHKSADGKELETNVSYYKDPDFKNEINVSSTNKPTINNTSVKFVLKKTDAEDNSKTLSNAMFTLQKLNSLNETTNTLEIGDNVTSEPVSTNDSGLATFNNLSKNKSYLLTETKAPNGYDVSGPWLVIIKNDGKIEFKAIKFNEDSNTNYSVIGNSVKNFDVLTIDTNPASIGDKQKKYTLPSTGGMGTKKYYLLGTLLSMLGVIYIVMKLGKGGLFGKEDHS